MGWTFVHNWKTKKDATSALRRNGYLFFEVLGTRTVGNHFWMAVDNGDTKFIVLALLSRQNGIWGYKDMDESMHPYYYDCPLSLLELVPEHPNPSAVEWRKQVRAYHEEQKRKKETLKLVEVGDVVELEGYKIKDLRVVSLKPFLGETEEGKTYRIPKKGVKSVRKDF